MGLATSAEDLARERGGGGEVAAAADFPDRHVAQVVFLCALFGVTLVGVVGAALAGVGAATTLMRGSESW